LKSRNKASEL